MSNGLCIRRTLDGAASSLSPILNGSLGQPRLPEMMRHQLGLRFDCLGEPLHEGIGNATVKLLALAPHHSGVGRILNQRMLEDIRRIRWFAADEDQLASGKLRKRSLERGAGDGGDRSEQAIWEFATYSSANLRDLSDRTKPIKTCGQRAQQRCRNGQRWHRANGDVPLTCILEQAR